MLVLPVLVLVLATVGNVANGERHAEHVPLRVRMMEAEAGLLEEKVVNERGRIYGGNYASIAQFPFVLSMHYVSFHICGASVISENWAISAAHCLDKEKEVKDYYFRAGSEDRLKGGLVVPFARFHIHPNFVEATFTYDIAVIRGAIKFVGPNIAPVNLIARNARIPENLPAKVLGWGLTQDGSLSVNLKEVTVRTWLNHKCEKMWPGEVTRNKICAGGMEGLDSCNGDSGGPLVYKGIQIGLVSWGASKCGLATPAVYTNLTDPAMHLFITHYTGRK